MRGHWLSQTRKLNKHYQSGGTGGTGETTWNPLAGCLYKMTKGGVTYYPAPSYCVLHNGSMLQEIFYNRQYSPSAVAGVEISEEQVLEYVPYFPKSSDSYYIGTNLNPVSWKAYDALDVIENDSQEVIVSFNAGEDLSSKNANLLKLTYAGYVLKKSGLSRFNSAEWLAVCQMLEQMHGNAKIDGRGFFTGYPTPGFYPENMVGDFSWSSYPPNGINFMSDFVGNSGFYAYSQSMHAFKYPAFTVHSRYVSTGSWSGEQKVRSLVSASIPPYITSNKGGLSMQGFASGSGSSTPTSLYDLSFDATFAPIQILKKVEGVTCPITG